MTHCLPSKQPMWAQPGRSPCSHGIFSMLLPQLCVAEATVMFPYIMIYTHISYVFLIILNAFTDLQSTEASTIPIQATRININMTPQKNTLQYYKCWMAFQGENKNCGEYGAHQVCPCKPLIYRDLLIHWFTHLNLQWPVTN